jgi:hypothetical protein
MGVSIRISAECHRRGRTVYTPPHWQDLASHISHLPAIAMLRRRRSKKATPGHVSPPPASGSVSGKRSLNPVIQQEPFRASMAQMAETEAIISEIEVIASETEATASETSRREILPVPLRPVSFPPSPPSGSGSRLQRTGHDTVGTSRPPPFEERVSPQPPNVMHMPTPLVPQTPGPPASPMRSHQPTPGGGVGGFVPIPSPHHESGRDHFHYNTADYTYRFDQKFTHSDSSSPPYETAGISEGVHAGIWSTYNRVSEEFDEKRLTKWNEDLDVLLIFVSLMVKGDR